MAPSTDIMKPADCPSRYQPEHTAQVASNKRAGNPDQDGNEAPAAIFAGHKKFCQGTDDQADDQRSDEAKHGTPFEPGSNSKSVIPLLSSESQMLATIGRCFEVAGILRGNRWESRKNCIRNWGKKARP
jgi:hypothetical protein